MSLSLNFRSYRIRARLFFWFYHKVRDLYFFLDTHAFKTYRFSAEFFDKKTLKLAKTVADRQCTDSGRCAIKNWKSSPEIMQKAEELAWKARQETKEEELNAYEEAMSKVASVRPLTPEERAAAQKTIDEINKLDDR